jgi:hypothetical protein
MQGDRYLSAFFTPAYLNVASGSFGPINVSPPGGDCSFADDPATGAETPCQFLFPLNTTVTLQRDPAQAQNSTDQWTGSCKGAGETCTFKIRKNEYVAAGADPTQDIPTRVGEGITLMRKGAKGGRIVLRPLSGTGRGLVCRKKKCSQGGYRRSDNVLIVAKGTRRVKFVRWGDSRWPSARRSLKVGDHNPVLAIFRRR